MIFLSKMWVVVIFLIWPALLTGETGSQTWPWHSLPPVGRLEKIVSISLTQSVMVNLLSKVMVVLIQI